VKKTAAEAGGPPLELGTAISSHRKQPAARFFTAAAMSAAWQ
jgi:hypothetical protein